MAPSWSLRAAQGLAGTLPQPAGLLLGAVDEGARTITLLGAVPAPAAGGAKDVAAAAAKVLDLVPFGVHVVGSYGCPAPPPAAHAPHGAPAVGAQPGGGFTLGGAPAAAEELAVPPGALALPGLSVIRAHVDLLLRVAAGPGGPTEQALAHAFVEAAQQLAGPQLVYVSEPKPGAAPVLLTPAAQGSVSEAIPAASLSPSDPCPSLAPLIATGPAPGAPAPGAPAPAAPAAPVFEFSPAAAGSSVWEVPLGLDVLAVVAAAAPASALGGAALAPALRRQLDGIERLLAERLNGSKQQGEKGVDAKGGAGGGAAALAPVRAYHFRPPGWALPVTAVYPLAADSSGDLEAPLLRARAALHGALGLPSDVPMLRFANALRWGGGGSGGGGGQGDEGKVARLRDVHVGVSPPSIGGAPSLIRGSYEYYHYMQDRFNDSGWGCAYRSLQTIVSWFRQQRYTAKPVPAHREIQQLLVKLGDKDASFIGSSNWIGAIELSYILSEYLGVTSKIMTVNRGADIPSHARELAAHFETQGTPVMIGGGVLAYTLLGVQFDELTGEAAFLILDPHYTGGEDLKKIQAGTWVAWKVPGDSAAAGGPLYVEDTFYNFLLPQRPNTV